MKRKPYAYIARGYNDQYAIFALNCKHKVEALYEMLKIWDDKDIYLRPEFKDENVEEIRNQYCRSCGTFEADNICSNCERNLQGRIHVIYAVYLELK